MYAAVWHGANDLRLEEREKPEALPGTVVVKVESCAICGSDLRILREGNNRIQAPRILGHEIAGSIVEVGEGVTSYKVNDRISTGADIPCGDCEYCNAGLPNSCAINYAIGYQFDGGFAEYIRLDEKVVRFGPLQKFDAKLDWNKAALAEPLGCCINGFEQALADYKKPRSMVVFGAGPIGLMLIKLAKSIYNIDLVVAVEPSPIRRNNAILAGASFAIDPIHEDVVERALHHSAGKGLDIIFTACPVLETHKQALEVVAPNGVINLFGGIGKNEPALNILSNHIHYKQIYVTGSHGSTPAQHRKALHYIEQNMIVVDDLISHEYDIKDVIEGFTMAASGNASKVVIKP